MCQLSCEKKCVFSVYSLCIFQQILLSILRYENGNEHDTFHHNKNISKNLNFQGQQRNHAAQVCDLSVSQVQHFQSGQAN